MSIRQTDRQISQDVAAARAPARGDPGGRRSLRHVDAVSADVAAAQLAAQEVEASRPGAGGRPTGQLRTAPAGELTGSDMLRGELT